MRFIYPIFCIFVILSFLVARPFECRADNGTFSESDTITLSVTTIVEDSTRCRVLDFSEIESIYAHPYSIKLREPDWHRMWVNTAVLSGAFVGTLFVLECLPEDATSWNREEIHSVPMFKRWFRNIFKKGPEWDHDRFYFNFILHPYAGAVYFMSARSCGFNTWQSLLYCTCVSTIGWEFGVEAFMERPSYQDLFITPLLGSAIGEGFYCIKRKIAANGYRLCGSKVLGNVVAFLVDPVNEVVGLFAGNPARRLNRELTLSPVIGASVKGFSFSATF